MVYYRPPWKPIKCFGAQPIVIDRFLYTSKLRSIQFMALQLYNKCSTISGFFAEKRLNTRGSLAVFAVFCGSLFGFRFGFGIRGSHVPTGPQGSGFGIFGFGVRGSGFGVRGSGFGVRSGSGGSGSVFGRGSMFHEMVAVHGGTCSFFVSAASRLLAFCRLLALACLLACLSLHRGGDRILADAS